MFIASALLSLIAAGVVFADSGYHSGYSQSTESCSIVTTKSGPELSCQCKITDTDKKACSISLNSILVNNKQGQLQYYPGGGAFASCEEYSLLGTVLGADCGGKSIALIDLDKICGNESGNLQCGPKESPASSKPASSAVISSLSVSSSVPVTSVTSSTSGAPSTTNAAQGSSQTSVIAESSSSTPSPITGAASTSEATATSLASDSADSDNSCSSLRRRMRMMERSYEV